MTKPQQDLKPLVFTLKQIKDTCEKYDCDDGCPLYIDKDSCLFRIMPEDWDLKEIEERIKL